MIYLDNAATSFPKPKSVVNEVAVCLKQYCGNPGRSSHRLAIEAANKIFDTRVLISEFLSYGKCENVVFTPNATYALNLVIKGMIRERCHCIISDLEHNSVLRPLYKMLNRYGGEVSVFNTDLAISEAIGPLLRPDTKFIISTLSSNVTGKTVDIYELSRVARANDLKLILDASQFLGHRKLDLNGIYFSALCSAGHKALFGIQGSGFAVINDPELMDTLCEGGSGIDSFARHMPDLLPERYEAGTLPTPAIASLHAGISFINRVGIDNIESKLQRLSALMAYELSELGYVEIYGAENGIVSFNVKDYSSSQVSNALDGYGIATRSGFHCSPLIHERLGTTERGAVRASLSYFNTESDIYKLCKVLRDL